MNKKHLVIFISSCSIIAGVMVQVLRAQERALHLSDSSIVVVPFRDESGFEGKWNLRIDIPRYLAFYVREKLNLRTIQPTVVDQYIASAGILPKEQDTPAAVRLYAEKFGSRYVITAALQVFDVARFTIAEPTVAGYESFSAEVRVFFTLYDASILTKLKNAVLYEGEAVGLVKDRGLGLTLFGKRTERTSQFFSLDNYLFGGEQFNKTIIGEAVRKCAEEFGAQIERALPALKQRAFSDRPGSLSDTSGSDSAFVLRAKTISGEIVVIDNNEVFVNLGSDDGLIVGDVLPVFREGEKLRDPVTNAVLGKADVCVGEIRIIEIRASHLSLGIVSRNSESILPRYRVRTTVVR